MKRHEHNEKKWIFPFVEYSFDATNEKVPLIIQLHGAGERGDGRADLHLVDVNGFSKLVSHNDYKCMLVMPQCPKNTFWVARVESIIKFIQQLKAVYNIDEKRIYLTGMSMGGYGTWYTAMACPDMFAAIAPVCGGGMAWNANVLNMPIWVFHGVDDDVVSVNQSDEMVEQLKLYNKYVTYSRINHKGHDVWNHAYNSELIEWLLSKERI